MFDGDLDEAEADDDDAEDDAEDEVGSDSDSDSDSDTRKESFRRDLNWNIVNTARRLSPLYRMVQVLVL
jgi:hypothetical protein